MNSFNLMQVLSLGQLNFRTGFLDTHPYFSSLLSQLLRGQEKLPGRKLSQNNHRKPPPKEDNFLKILNFSPHHLQWIAAALLFNKHLVSNGQRRGNEGLRGGVEVCVCVGGQDHFLFNYAAGPSGCSLERTLPPSALLSLSPSRTRLGRGLHSPRRSLGSPLLFPPPLLRPRRPTSRTPPPFCKRRGNRAAGGSG